MTNTRSTLDAITIQSGRNKITYSVVDNLLITEKGTGTFQTRSTLSLQGLSPRLVVEIERHSGTVKTIRFSALAIALAAVVFFSDYNSSIPLLAPLLFGVGLIKFLNGVRHIYPRSWTVIRNTAGEEVRSLLQPKEKGEAWSTFEKVLSETIVAANRNET